MRCVGRFIDVLFGREAMDGERAMQPPQTILQVNCVPCLGADYKIISCSVRTLYLPCC